MKFKINKMIKKCKKLNKSLNYFFYYDINSSDSLIFRLLDFDIKL